MTTEETTAFWELIKIKTTTGLEEMQGVATLWITTPGRKSHPKFTHGCKKLQYITQELCRREIELTGGIEMEGRKTSGLVEWARSKNDPMVDLVQDTIW